MNGKLCKNRKMSTVQEPLNIHIFVCSIPENGIVWCFFTESAHLVDSVIELRCPSVCVSVCDVSKHPLPEVVDTSGRRTYS